MPRNILHNYLLCYDISDGRRLNRVRQAVALTGRPLQYSVFLVTTTEKGLEKLIDDLEREIDPREDDIRIYPLEDHTVIQTLGQHPVQMEGIRLVGPTDRVLFEKLESVG